MSAEASEAKRLQGRVAIITGGASGIGAATAKLFVAHGAKVIVADIQDQLGQKLAHELGPDADYLHCDVANENDIAATVNFATSKYGCLDVMFNNAAVASFGLGSITEVDVKDFDRTMEVNVRGVLLGVKHAARAMVPAKRGCILCTASVASVLVSGSSHPYAISKHAVVGIMKSTAVELGQHGIRVNCISPSAIATPLVMNIFNRIDSSLSRESVAKVFEELSDLQGVRVEEEDIAKAALYLASEDGQCVSGHNLMVDGAFTISRPWNPFIKLL